MVKIILSGCCGKMGHVVRESVSKRDDCEIVAGVDLQDEAGAVFPVFHSFRDVNVNADVIIDFSHPSVLEELLDFAERREIASVLATTGYSDEQVKKIHDYAERTPIFFSFNMSLGMNLMVELAKKATCILSDSML